MQKVRGYQLYAQKFLQKFLLQYPYHGIVDIQLLIQSFDKIHQEHKIQLFHVHYNQDMDDFLPSC